jgi:hypothetical protein
MLEKMVNAVNSVEHRKLAWGRNQKMEKFEFNRPQMSDMVQVTCSELACGQCPFYRCLLDAFLC